MNINHHIRIFLYQNGSLILPSLGIFKTVYQSAKPDPRKRMFYPPRKTVEFVEDSTPKDTSFEKYLAKAEKIKLIDASKELQNYIEELKNALKKGKKVYLNHIGVLSMGKDQQIIFSPDQKENFIPEASSSDALNVKPVKRSKSDLKKNVSKDMVTGKGKKGNNASVLWTVLLLILLFVIVYLIINPLNYSFVEKHYSGVLPLVEICKLNIEEKQNASESSTGKKKMETIPQNNQGKEKKQPTTKSVAKQETKEQKTLIEDLKKTGL